MSAVQYLQEFYLDGFVSHMKVELFSIVTACSLFHVTSGFKARLPPLNTFSQLANLVRLHANPLDDDIAPIAQTDGGNDDDDDDDFLAMQREIEQTMSSSTNITDSSFTVVSSTELQSKRNYNKFIAVASAVLGSFFFVLQHSQPVSGISLMHAMEHDSVELQVHQMLIPSALFFLQHYFSYSIIAVLFISMTHISAEVNILALKSLSSV